MTPFGLALQHRLEKETRRMENEWFFKWHYIGKDGPVEIDSFDGRMLKYGGKADFSAGEFTFTQEGCCRLNLQLARKIVVAAEAELKI